MTRVLLTLALVATSCAAPNGPWRVQGVASAAEEAQALQLVEAARAVLPDEKGWLAQGGHIYLFPDVRGVCSVPPPKVPTGCCTTGRVWVLHPHPVGGYDVARSALAHELAHLGLASGGGFGGPLDLVSEARADAGALLVVQEYRRATAP